MRGALGLALWAIIANPQTQQRTLPLPQAAPQGSWSSSSEWLMQQASWEALQKDQRARRSWLKRAEKEQSHPFSRALRAGSDQQGDGLRDDVQEQLRKHPLQAGAGGAKPRELQETGWIWLRLSQKAMSIDLVKLPASKACQLELLLRQSEAKLHRGAPGSARSPGSAEQLMQLFYSGIPADGAEAIRRGQRAALTKLAASSGSIDAKRCSTPGINTAADPRRA